MQESFDFLFFDSFFHLANVTEHFDGITENVYRGFTMIDDLDGHFHNFCAKLHGDQNDLQIKSKAVDLAIGKDFFRNVVAEALDSALGIGKLEACGNGDHFDIGFGSQLSQGCIAFVTVSGQITGAYDDIRIGVGKCLRQLSERFRSVSIIAVCEKDQIALRGKNARANGIAFSVVFAI